MREKPELTVIEHIIKMTNSGVRKVAEMQRHIDSFVGENFDEEGTDTHRRRFHPLDQDVRNYMKKARYANRFSKDDQLNLSQIVKQWEESQPADTFMYRSHGISDDESKKTNFLFCYQTEWQRRLLAKYGNQFCLLDATSRTSRCALPLFFLCVRTNVGYFVVGVFILQQETTECIKEALEIFKQWNPNWQPTNLMTD